MKLTFLRYNTNNQLKKNKTAHASTPFTKVQSAGILFTVEDKSKHEIVKELLKRLQHEGKKVFVLAFLPEKKENFEFLFNYFTQKDISFWGQLQSEDALKFVDMPLDNLYCLDESYNPMVLNILARCKAKCRIGKYAEGHESFFELMIESKQGIKGLMEESYRYTRELR